MRAKATALGNGGSMPIAAISPDKPVKRGFELNDEILTLFERFEIVWPLHIADVTVFRWIRNGARRERPWESWRERWPS